MASAIRRLPIPNSMKRESFTFESSEDGLSKEVQKYIGRKLHDTCIEYGDISGIAYFPFLIISKTVTFLYRC